MRILHFGWIIPIFLGSVCLGEEGYFWQLTDLHYDPWYAINQESCNEELSVVGKYGDYECDAPWELVYASVKAMVDKGRDAEFILWSGDNPPHVKNSDVINEEIILEITKNITDIILEFFPNKMVLPVLGNHDYYPKNQLPGENNDLYNGYVDLWSMWLNTTDMKDTFRKGAYYTRMLSNSPKVRAVVLNTNLYLAENTATEGDQDPGGQIAWFESVMDRARSDGEKVHLFTHVPPGIMEVPATPRWLKKEFNQILYDLIVKHSELIIGYYGAHSHTDTFRLFYKEQGDPVSSLFIPPSVTPWKARLDDGIIGPPHNPALRCYIFEKSNYELIDVEQFSLNLPAANNMLDADWLFLYSYRQSYGIANVSTPQLQILLDSMKTFASEKFHTYYDMNTVGTNTEDDPQKPCDCLCKSRHLCAIAYVDYTQFDQCNEERPACDSAVSIQGDLGHLAMLLFGLLVSWQVL